jgi:hypothetical protein
VSPHPTILQGEAATHYVGAWMRSAAPGHRGLNASRLRADALAGARSVSASARLRLASTCRARVLHRRRIVCRAATPGRARVCSRAARAARGRAAPQPRPRHPEAV